MPNAYYHFSVVRSIAPVTVDLPSVKVVLCLSTETQEYVVAPNSEWDIHFRPYSQLPLALVEHRENGEVIVTLRSDNYRQAYENLMASQ